MTHRLQTRRELFRGGLALLTGAMASASTGCLTSPGPPTGLAAAPLRRVTISKASEGHLDPFPRAVKAVYLSYYGIGDRTIRGHVFELLDRTELNAVVIDVKGDRGFIPYESEIPLAREAGAVGAVRVHDLDDMLAGLNEVQFDYLRFPTEGTLGAARYAKPNTQASRLEAVAAFLARARAALAPVGASLAVDLFGYTALNPDDTGIGQRIEELAGRRAAGEPARLTMPQAMLTLRPPFPSHRRSR